MLFLLDLWKSLLYGYNERKADQIVGLLSNSFIIGDVLDTFFGDIVALFIFSISLCGQCSSAGSLLVITLKPQINYLEKMALKQRNRIVQCYLFYESNECLT